MTEDNISKTLFGQCAYGPKDLDKHNCPGRYQRWYIGKIGTGRGRKDGVVYLDEYRACTCDCHIPEDERPKPKRRRRKT